MILNAMQDQAELASHSIPVRVVSSHVTSWFPELEQYSVFD